MKFSGFLKIRITKSCILILTFMYIINADEEEGESRPRSNRKLYICSHDTRCQETRPTQENEVGVGKTHYLETRRRRSLSRSPEDSVTVEASRRRAKSVFLVPSQISEGAVNRNLDIFPKPPNGVYSLEPIFKTTNASRPNAVDVLSLTDGSVLKRKGINILQENALGAGTNTTRDEYFLGYSNNVFESYTKYIKQVSPNYYAPNDISGQKRRKRSVLHLYNMVLCATGCNPLSYKGYGCYCGFLGSGYVVDGIDRCCKIHDWCYDTAGCPMFLEYFIPYLWKCYNHHYPLCAIDHGEFGGPGSCAQKLCECDRQLAQCLRMYPCPSSKALCTSSPWRLLQNLFMN